MLLYCKDIEACVHKMWRLGTGFFKDVAEAMNCSVAEEW